MFKSFSVKNFRCFRDFTIEPLERINLIAGMNNAGKTALLEAIILHMGSNDSQYSLSLDSSRGIQQVDLDAEEVWGWLFRNRNYNDTIELTSQDFDGDFCLSHISLKEPTTSTLTPLSTIKTVMRELIIEYKDNKKGLFTSKTRISDDGKFLMERDRQEAHSRGIFIRTNAHSPQEDAKRYSKLERANRIEKEVLPTMKIVEPRLRRLSLLTIGKMLIIHGDIGIGELIPLQLMGEGLLRLLQIVLAINEAPGGAILIDEIENGLHHSVMINVWKAIAEAARQSDTQVFATTHSWECIQAAHVAFQQSETYDFRLHRLDRIDDEIKSVTYDQDMLSTASDTDLEVR